MAIVAPDMEPKLAEGGSRQFFDREEAAWSHGGQGNRGFATVTGIESLDLDKFFR